MFGCSLWKTPNIRLVETASHVNNCYVISTKLFALHFLLILTNFLLPSLTRNHHRKPIGKSIRRELEQFSFDWLRMVLKATFFIHQLNIYSKSFSFDFDRPLPSPENHPSSLDQLKANPFARLNEQEKLFSCQFHSIKFSFSSPTPFTTTLFDFIDYVLRQGTNFLLSCGLKTFASLSRENKQRSAGRVKDEDFDFSGKIHARQYFLIFWAPSPSLSPAQVHIISSSPKLVKSFENPGGNFYQQPKEKFPSLTLKQEIKYSTRCDLIIYAAREASQRNRHTQTQTHTQRRARESS